METQRLFFQSCLTGNVENIKQALYQGADIQAKDIVNQQSTGLFLTSCQNHLDATLFLLTEGAATVNVKNSFGQTPLMAAISNKNYSLVEVLIKQGANINALDNQNRSPLMYAIKSENIEICKSIIDHGAQLNIADDYSMTPLAYAARQASFTIFKKLINAGSDIHFYPNEKYSPLAVTQNMTMIYKLLLNGADLNIAFKHHADQMFNYKGIGQFVSEHVHLLTPENQKLWSKFRLKHIFQ